MRSHIAAASSSKKALSAFALAVAAGVGGLATPSVEAAPYLTVNVVGRVQGSGAPFSSSVPVGAGDVVEYEIQVQLGAEESINPYAGATAAATTTTISNWIPSNGATSPASGLSQVRFHLDSGGAATFAAPSVPAFGWADSPGNSGGTPTGSRLEGLNLIRAAGNFDGVAGTPVAQGVIDPAPAVLELLTIASGTFTAVSQGEVNPNLTGGAFLDTTVLATMRWRNDSNTSSVNYNPTRLQQNNSTTGTAQGNNAIDPIIIYNGLNLVPEPAGLSVIAIGALGLGLRRRRA